MGEHIVELLSTAAPAFERATEIHAMVRHEHRPLPANHQKNHFARRLCIERDMASMVGMELYLHFDSTKMSKSIIKTMINWEYSSKKIKTTIYQDFLIFNHFFYVKKKQISIAIDVSFDKENQNIYFGLISSSIRNQKKPFLQLIPQ